MNPSKTEFILFGNKVQLDKCNTVNKKIGDLIVRSEVICYLGAWLDSNLNYKQHAMKKCQVAMANFQRIKSICHLLIPTTCANLCVSLCLSHLDYCNSILTGLPDVTINQLQRVQNMCAKLVLRKGKYDSLTECMKELHWLPIKYRIMFKVLVLICKCLNGDTPVCLTDLIVPIQPTREGLRSLERFRLSQMKCKTFAVRSFSVSAPVL